MFLQLWMKSTMGFCVYFSVNSVFIPFPDFHVELFHLDWEECSGNKRNGTVFCIANNCFLPSDFITLIIYCSKFLSLGFVCCWECIPWPQIIGFLEIFESQTLAAGCYKDSSLVSSAPGPLLGHRSLNTMLTARLPSHRPSWDVPPLTNSAQVANTLEVNSIDFFSCFQTLLSAALYATWIEGDIL